MSVCSRATFTPAGEKPRVYHRRSAHAPLTAFNALLKILEEPPEHLKFILATTKCEGAGTILSRCQRLDFHRITPATIAA